MLYECGARVRVNVKFPRTADVHRFFVLDVRTSLLFIAAVSGAIHEILPVY